MMKITSLESLDAAAAEHARRVIALNQANAAMAADVAAIKEKHQDTISKLVDDVGNMEAAIREWLACHAEVLGDKKCRETEFSRFGFARNVRVDTASPEVTFNDVVDRLLKLSWGDEFLRYKSPEVNKQAFLAAKESIAPSCLAAAGVRIVTEDSFFIRPKVEKA